MTAPLQLSAAQMRALGYACIDAIVEHLDQLPMAPVGPSLEAQNLTAFMPEEPRPTEDVLAEVLAGALSQIVPQDHPRYLATIPSPGNFVGAAAELLAAGFNVFSGNWAEGEGPAKIESAVIAWLARVCGFPDSAGGLCVSGGSQANLTALVAARYAALGDNPTRAAFYLTEQAHSCFRRIARVLGISSSQVIVVPTDERGRMQVSALAQLHRQTLAAGLRPFAVVATAGSTNTGVVDPLDDLVNWCRGAGMWLHVDGAYGGAGVLDPANAELLHGLSEVDSLALDPHKWWFQPFGIGALIVRRPVALAAAFKVVPDYLEQLHSGSPDEIDYYDYGFEVTRPFRALKVWMSVQIFGVAAIRSAIIAGRECSERIAAGISEIPGWTIVTKPQLAISTFRFSGTGSETRSQSQVDHLMAEVLDQLAANARVGIIGTKVNGRPVVRLCAMNPRITPTDEKTIIDAFREAGLAAQEQCW